MLHNDIQLGVRNCICPGFRYFLGQAILLNERVPLLEAVTNFPSNLAQISEDLGKPWLVSLMRNGIQILMAGEENR